MNGNVSMSNIVKHYRTTHRTLYDALMTLEQSNATEVTIRSCMERERKRTVQRRSNTSIARFFGPRTGQEARHVGNDSSGSSQDLPSTVLQAIAVLLFACATETPFERMASPLLHGVVDVFGGRAQFSSKAQVNKVLYDTYTAICCILKRSVTNANTGSITVDGWGAALRAPILGMTWHFIDSNWKMRCVPIAILNMSTAVKTGQQMRCVIEEVLEQSPIVGSDDIRVYTATSDNEAATALAVDLLSNFVGSVRCVVHTLAMAVNDVFEDGTVWSKYLQHVNKVTTCFNHHQKAAQLLSLKQMDEGNTQDRIQRLQHDITTRWNSRFAAMSVYLCRIGTINAVVHELNISSEDVPSLTTEQQDVLAEFIAVLAEIRRVARQLEEDRKVTISRASRLLPEVYETLLIMVGDMLPSSAMAVEGTPGGAVLDEEDSILDVHALQCRPSPAHADRERDEARQIRLRKTHPKALAIKLADRIGHRLGDVWKKVDVESAMWAPNDHEATEPDREIFRPRRVLLFHVAAVLDINECCLDFIKADDSARESYMKVLHGALVREAAELDSSLAANSQDLEVVFGLFHKGMRDTLTTAGRREPSAALSFWNEANYGSALISPVPFNTIARAALSAQAFSAPAERLFSDLGRAEGNQAQSLLSSTLEMMEMIRVYVANELKDIRLPQSGRLQHHAEAFKRLAHVVAREIRNN